MNHDSPPIIKKTPVYKKWWFLTITILGLIYIASIAAVPLLQNRLQERLNPPVTIMYKWTDEDGVTHYSDIKPEAPAEEIPFISNTTAADTVELIETKVYLFSLKIRPVLGKLLIAVIAAFALLKGLTAAGAYTERRKGKRNAEAFMTDLEACVQKAMDFGSGLISTDIDKTRYTENLSDLRSSLENIINNPSAREDVYSKVIEYLQKAVETYIDCLSLWNMKSQREITASDKKGFLKKYPALLDRTTGGDKPLPPKELRRAVRTAIWDYASRYVTQAERLFATAKSMEEQSKPDAQSGSENTIDK
jgi:hypothetical protein